MARGALEMVLEGIQKNAGIHEDTMHFCRTGPLQTCGNQKLLEEMNLDGEEKTIFVAGIHGTSPIQSKNV